MSQPLLPGHERIVVGVHDSTSSWAAVRLAAREAAAQHRPLRLLHALNWIPDDLSTGEEPVPDAQQLIDRAVQVVAQAAPGLEVTAELSENAPATALLRESRMASLVVIGDGDLARWTCLPLDALAVQIAARADCSVLVARCRAEEATGAATGTGTEPTSGTGAYDGPVVVGVDGSAGSERALGFAFDTAAARRSELIVVRAWESELSWADASPDIGGELADTLAPWQEKHPDVPVRQQVVTGSPAQVIIERSVNAGLVVVGARGDHPLRVPLGAVSQAVLHHARCPTAIVRECAPPPTAGD